MTAADPAGTVRAERRGEPARSVCVQTETPPYQYVSVEGPIVAIEPADVERDLRWLTADFAKARESS